jgi:ribosomal protein L12E/L44/L45/RPP1/RPP2
MRKSGLGFNHLIASSRSPKISWLVKGDAEGHSYHEVFTWHQRAFPESSLSTGKQGF